ncbi:VOC family protein [soil metagenome]
MSATVQPFLMFEGRCEEAMRFYISLLPHSQLLDLTSSPDGKVMKATFTIAGQTVMCSDSPVKHGFTFTPASSLFVQCESEDQLRTLAAKLGEGGTSLMPLGHYGFSTLFAWVNDRFGVSWQLNLV